MSEEVGPGHNNAYKIRRKALDLLSKREHSRAELAEKLYARGFNRDAVDAVLSQLLGEELICDARFAEGFVRKLLAGGYGPVRIRQGLRERGIAEDLISDYLEADEGEWHARIEQARCKRFGEPLPTTPRDRLRQIRFLQYRGFTAEQIRKLLRF